jgi:phage protein U
MYAQLGNRLFNNLKSFSEYNKTGSAIYAEHALIDTKPRLQRTGLALDEITLSIRFHVAFCNPAEEIESLRQSRDEGEILPLLWGNGKVEGYFVITSLYETIEEADQQGNIFSCTVTCNLKEMVVQNKLQQEQDNNRKNGIAVGDKKPIARKKTNPATCPQVISSIITKIENHAAVINKIVLEKGGAGTVENKNTIKSNLTSISKLCSDLVTRAENPQSCVNSYPNIKTRATAVKDESTVFIIEMDRGDLYRAQGDNNLLQTKVKALKEAARPLINQAITRK